MASGKSIVSQKLSKSLNWKWIDLDDIIAINEAMTIPDIFKNKGEIYFRKVESHYLKETLLNSDKTVIALGGGTPCYANNMSVIHDDKNSKSIYLNVSIPELSKRLFNDKVNRPLVTHILSLEEMTEFVGKHLFERLVYYNQANIRIDANENFDKVVDKILLELF
jgi:shikimate kinase